MTSKGITLKELCERHECNYLTFYSRLQRAVKKGEPYPYPCKRPYEQYIPLMTKTRKYVKSKDPMKTDLDEEWKRICKRMNNPDSREIAYLRVLNNIFNNELMVEIQSLIRRKDTIDAEDPYKTFQKEQGLWHDDKGRPSKED